MSPRTLAFACAATVSVGLACLAPSSAHAQCSASSSSCTRCHEAQGAKPVLSDGRPWHVEHAFADVCVGCHAGDPAATTAAAAHASMKAPLADARATCGACHADASAGIARYVAATSLPGAPPSSPPPSPTAGPCSAPTPPSPTRRGDAVLAIAIAAVAALGGALAIHRERGLSPVSLRERLRAAGSSAVVTGAGLGVVGGVSIAFFGRPLSASAAFDRLGAYFGRALAPHAAYFRFTVPPAIDWSVWLMIGVLLGAYLSSAFSGSFRFRAIPDEGWSQAFGTSRVVRAFVAFVGGAVVQFAAGIAGGCTSGLAISGGIVLAPAAFLFMMGMFAGGIPTAWLVHRRSAP